MTRKQNVLLGIATFSLALGFLLGLTNPALALEQNRLIDDTVFDNVGTMNAGQIDNFLNQFSSSCISLNNSFSAIDPTGYNSSSGYSFGGNVSAGQVIAHAAQAYDINPQVLLVTLQKEQGLVTGGGGCSTLRYAAATGYGCPDGGVTHDYSGVNLYTRNGVTVTSVSGTCVNSGTKAGFSQQVIRAAWLLKFGEQRSEGNINWAIVRGNWNNSDDPQSCYGGPMTQGHWQVCPSGPSVDYDGYKTIDGVSVHMDTGSTASLYWYTPHFHGNQVFVDTFNSWFGSTHVSGKWLRQSTSTHQVWLVAEGLMPNNTVAKKKFKLTNWDTYIAYNLGTEPVVPVSDDYLAQYEDGGTLGTIASSRSYNEFQFMDNGRRFFIPDITPCAKNLDGSANTNTTWGLDCFNTNVVKTIPGNEFLERLPGVGSITPLLTSNHVTYKLQGGSKLPIFDEQTLHDMGYNWGSTTNYQGINAQQPTGKLQMSHDTVVAFNGGPFLLYDHAADKFYKMNGSVFDAWGLGRVSNATPAPSSFNSSPPTIESTELSIWQTSGGRKYLIDSGRKVDVTNIASELPSVTWQTTGQDVLNNLQTAISGSYIWVRETGGVYQVSGGKKRHVPSWNDFVGLGLDFRQLLPVSSYTASQIPGGSDLLADASIFETSTGVHTVSNGHSFHIPSWPFFGVYQFDLGNMVKGQESLNTAYPSDGELKSMAKSVSGDHYLINNGSKLPISTDVMNQWGLTDGNFITLSDRSLGRLSTGRPLGRFIMHSGGAYYAQDGKRHYIQSFGTFAALGGDLNNLPIVEDDFYNTLPAGNALP